MQVHNFTITREGLGSIRWLRPVNVVGLQLDRIVTIQQGASGLQKMGLRWDFKLVAACGWVDSMQLDCIAIIFASAWA